LLLFVFFDEVGLRARQPDTGTPRHGALGADLRRTRPAVVGGSCAGGREPVTSTVVCWRRIACRKKERRDGAVERGEFIAPPAIDQAISQKL